MAITRKGSTVGSSGTVTVPTHIAGDLIVIETLTPANVLVLAPSGWTLAGNSANANGAYAIGWKIAASGSEVSDTWQSAGLTPATFLRCTVFSGHDSSTPIGTPAYNAVLSGSSISYPALTLGVGDGSSWVLRGAVVKSTVPDLSTTVAGYEVRHNPDDGSNQAQFIDSNGGVASVSSQTLALGGTYLRGAYSVEVRADTADASAATRRRRYFQHHLTNFL